MATLPFASQPVTQSVWGCSENVKNTYLDNRPALRTLTPTRNNAPSSKVSMDTELPTDSYANQNLEYMPAVLLNTLKREKKPFTYTPGRIDLSEVLNDKLQKRMERRKKRAEERSLPESPVPDLPAFESSKQVLVMPTYNTPLNMYSMENALEALEVQAELTLSDNSFSGPSRSQSMTLPRNYKYEPKDFDPKNVTQSKAFRVLQIITDTEEELGQNGIPKPSNCHHDEMRFTGIRTNESIPSKIFQNLQKMTSTVQNESVDSTAAGVHNNAEYYYDEKRFTGTRPNKVIPSKLFHNLQKMTGTEEVEESCAENSVPVSALNSGSWEVRFRPKDDMLRQVKNSLQGNQNQIVHKGETLSSIPCLQRPAAFLPAKQTTTCSPRFNATCLPNNTIQPFGRTNY